MHNDRRVLRRILSAAVKKKRLAVNPCVGVAFPIRIGATTRKPHYMSASEQERIESFAPDYLRDAIVILVELGLRPYKELTLMRKEDVDLENEIVQIRDSKTENGVADMPLTDLAKAAFERRLAGTPGSEYLFPTTRQSSKPYIGSFNKAWAAAVERASVEHFSIYELRRTFATRLSAAEVADHFVRRMLRQRDPAVFKRYSHAKLNTIRQALGKLDRRATEHRLTFGTATPKSDTFGTDLKQ